MVTKSITNKFIENEEYMNFGKLYIGQNLCYIEYDNAKFLQFDNIIVVKDTTTRGHLIYLVIIQFDNNVVATVSLNPSNSKEHNENFEKWLQRNNILLFSSLLEMSKSYKNYVTTTKFEIVQVDK